MHLATCNPIRDITGTQKKKLIKKKAKDFAVPLRNSYTFTKSQPISIDFLLPRNFFENQLKLHR